MEESGRANMGDEHAQCFPADLRLGDGEVFQPTSSPSEGISGWVVRARNGSTSADRTLETARRKILEKRPAGSGAEKKTSRPAPVVVPFRFLHWWP